MAELVRSAMLRVHLKWKVCGIRERSLPSFYVKGIELVAEALVDETAEPRLVRTVHRGAPRTY